MRWRQRLAALCRCVWLLLVWLFRHRMNAGENTTGTCSALSVQQRPRRASWAGGMECHVGKVPCLWSTLGGDSAGVCLELACHSRSDSG